MSLRYLSVLSAAFFLPVLCPAADAPLPELRIEPTNEASILYVKNVSPQPLTAFLIELVGYPGSYYQLWEDDITSEPIAPGVEKRIPISNMTVGAVPDYVKVRAALYADGTSAGIPEKVTQLSERRRSLLQPTRELISRLEKANAAGAQKAAIVADLKTWADSLHPLTKSTQNSQAAINEAAAKTLITEISSQLDTRSPDEVLTSLRAAERSLAANKPPM